MEISLPISCINSPNIWEERFWYGATLPSNIFEKTLWSKKFYQELQVQKGFKGLDNIIIQNVNFLAASYQFPLILIETNKVEITSVEINPPHTERTPYIEILDLTLVHIVWLFW